MNANLESLLEFLKCKPYLEKEDIKQLNATNESLKEFCETFGAKISLLKYDNEEYLFFNKDNVMIKNYSELEVPDNKYWKLVAQFRNQDDLDKAFKRICADARIRNLVEDNIRYL